MTTERMPAATKPSPWWSLRRVTSGGNYLPAIDGLRFVAILGVILYHLSGQLSKLARDHAEALAAHQPSPKGPAVPLQGSDSHLWFLGWGDLGVQLFFVISGFILALPYARARFGGRKAPTVRAFYLRRLTRLEPPFFLNILLLFLIAPIFAKGTLTYAGQIPHLLAHLLYSNNLLMLFRDGSVNAVAWSLEVELQFYLLVPLVALAFRAKPAVTRGILVGGILLFVAFDLLMHGTHQRVEWFLLGQAQFFLTGVLLSELYSSRDDRNLVFWDVAAIVALVGFIPLYERRELIALLVLPFGILVYAALASRFLTRLLALAPFATIGGMCYTIYLWHFMVISAATRFTTPLVSSSFDATLALQCLAVLPAIFLFCAVLFILVERPCMDRDWPAKVWRIFTHRRAPQDVQPTVSPDAPEIVEEP